MSAALAALEDLSPDQKLDVVEFLWLYSRAPRAAKSMVMRQLAPLLSGAETDIASLAAGLKHAVSCLRDAGAGSRGRKPGG